VQTETQMQPQQRPSIQRVDSAVQTRSVSPAPMAGFVSGTSPLYPRNMHGRFPFGEAHSATATAIRGWYTNPWRSTSLTTYVVKYYTNIERTETRWERSLYDTADHLLTDVGFDGSIDLSRLRSTAPTSPLSNTILLRQLYGRLTSLHNGSEMEFLLLFLRLHLLAVLLHYFRDDTSDSLLCTH